MRSILFCLIICQAAALHAEEAPGKGTDWKAKLTAGQSHDSSSQIRLPYQLYAPENAETRELPLVVFLHGAGQRGEDNQKQLALGVEAFVDDDFQAKHPCLVLVPQCPSDQKWTTTNWQGEDPRQAEQIAPALHAVLELVASIEQKYRTDRERLYLTGVSMGGSGSWDLITRHPERFTAALIVCGGVDHRTAGKASSVPLKVFQGADDPVVRASFTRLAIESLREAGGQPAYIEFDDAGHNIWNRVYQNQDNLIWLLSQVKAGPKP